MKAQIQANYEERLSRYVTLIQGEVPPGLVPKLAVYRELIRQHGMHGDRLWKIEPILHPLIISAETDLHLATARLLEEPRRAEGSLFAFLDFCMKNQANITWKSGPPPIGILEKQLDELESRRNTINAIMGRRDKFFAHLDKRYLKEPARIYVDYPLERGDRGGDRAPVEARGERRHQCRRILHDWRRQHGAQSGGWPSQELPGAAGLIDMMPTFRTRTSIQFMLCG